MESECQHENGSSIGFRQNDKTRHRKYQILREDAKKNGTRIYEVFLCTDCGKLIDENSYKTMSNEEIAAWIDALLISQRIRTIDFIEALP